MTTEKRFTPSYEAISKNGEYCGVVRGLWEMEGDMMGGPFVSHAHLDGEPEGCRGGNLRLCPGYEKSETAPAGRSFALYVLHGLTEKEKGGEKMDNVFPPSFY